MKTLTKTSCKSPLRYPGGKSKLIKHLEPFFPEHFEEYREPFVGGGSVFFHVKSNNMAKYYWINDADGVLISFYLACESTFNNRLLVHNLKDLLSMPLDYKKNHFNQLKLNRHLIDSTNYYFMNRCSFGGTGVMGGFSSSAAQFRFTESQINKLPDLVEVLDNVNITCTDYDFVIECSGRNVFIFCDPPYDGIDNLYYHSQFDHKRLSRLLKKCPHKFMLTYNNTENIRSLYKWANIREFKAIYGENQKGKAKQATELIITNY